MNPHTVLLEGAFMLLGSAGLLLAGALISYVIHFGPAHRVHVPNIHWFDRWHPV